MAKEARGAFLSQKLKKLPEVTVDVSKGTGLKENVWASKRIWLVSVKILNL